MTLGELTDTVAFVDPASSKSVLKKQRANAAIVVIQQDAWRRIFVRYAWRAKCHTNELTDEIFAVNAKYHPVVFGGEANSMQILYAESLAREARQRGVTLPILPVYQPPAQKKEWRIRAALQTPYAEGRIIFEHGQRAIIDEMLAFPQGRTVDLVDCLASAVALLPQRSLPVQRTDARRGLTEYLQARGVAPSIIRDRLEHGPPRP